MVDLQSFLTRSLFAKFKGEGKPLVVMEVMPISLGNTDL